ncbi:MAG: DUF1579 family protein [Polyangiales bacterium]
MASLHRKLEAFVGRWRVEGKTFASAPDECDTPVRGEESYELLPGGFFLVSRFDRATGDGKQIGTRVIGAGSASFRCDNFDQLGHRTYDVWVEGNQWTFTGDHERARQTFDASGESFDIAWETSQDGDAWKPLCSLRATRVS